MLTNPTIEILKSLKQHGMIEALEEQQQTPAVQALSFEERIALIVDRERLYRDNQRRSRLLRGAHLKVAEASIQRDLRTFEMGDVVLHGFGIIPAAGRRMKLACERAIRPQLGWA